MSTARPLPLPEDDVLTLKQQVAARLLEHRQRRGGHGAQAELPGLELPRERRRKSRVADSVAARFAGSVSYRDYLAQEAEAAVRQAEAAAEVARRNAEAVSAAQLRLLEELEEWNRADETAAEVEAQRAPVQHSHVPPAFSNAAPAVASAAPALSSTAAAAVSIEAPAASLLAALSPLLPDRMAEPPTPLPTNLIEFPRQLVAARKARARIAEGPLREEADASPERAQLRIFEVETDAFSAVPDAAPPSVLPEWSNLRLDTPAPRHETAPPDAQVSQALPLHTAPIAARVMAGVVDGCAIATALLLGVATVAMVSPEVPTGLAGVAACAGTLLFFTVIYFGLSFSFGDATPGMRFARIGLCTFSDENPTRAAMRRRLGAMALAAVPAGLGFVWALLDEDRLGWHDRISRMYPRAY